MSGTSGLTLSLGMNLGDFEMVKRLEEFGRTYDPGWL